MKNAFLIEKKAFSMDQMIPRDPRRKIEFQKP